jgi:hypothetical protein
MSSAVARAYVEADPQVAKFEVQLACVASIDRGIHVALDGRLNPLDLSDCLDGLMSRGVGALREQALQLWRSEALCASHDHARRLPGILDAQLLKKVQDRKALVLLVQQRLLEQHSGAIDLPVQGHLDVLGTTMQGQKHRRFGDRGGDGCIAPRLNKLEHLTVSFHAISASAALHVVEHDDLDRISVNIGAFVEGGRSVGSYHLCHAHPRSMSAATLEKS